MPGTRKLGRPTAHRNLMLRGMVTYLFEYGKIETTLTRAKEVRALADNMITLAKKNTLASYREALGYITKEDVAKKLFDQIAPAYENRNGGYTQIFKLGLNGFGGNGLHNISAHTKVDAFLHIFRKSRGKYDIDLGIEQF